MKLNRKWILILSLVLSVAMATGSTLAYMTTKTATVTNTFTLGNVSITLDEPKWDKDNAIIYPGTSVPKDPTITNTGRTPAWVWMEVEIPTAVYPYITMETIQDSDWQVMRDAATGIVTLMYKSELAAGKTATPFKSIKLDEKAALGDLESFKINVTGYAIQDSFDNVEDAYDAFHGITTTEVATADELTAALAGGGKVRLTDDVEVAATTKIPANTKAVIDLNGHDLVYNVSNAGKAAAVIENSGNLRITGTGEITFTAADPDLAAIPGYATNTITNTGSGTLTIGEGVTVRNFSDGGASYAVDVQSGTVIIDGATLIGNRCALRVARYNADTQFIMHSGTVEAGTPAWIQLPGSQASDAPKIDVTINGGTFQTTKDSSAENNILYTYTFGNSHENTKVTINGGEFLGGTVSIGSYYTNYVDAPTLQINGGTFEYDVLEWLSDDSSKVVFAANK